MPLTPVNCAAGVGCIEVGRDLASATPAKLLTQVNLAPDYIECVGGQLRVNLCDESQVIPAAAIPGLANGPGNLIRTVEGQCGLYAFAPQIVPAGNGVRVGVTGTLDGFSAVSKTITYTNPDTARRLVTIDCTLSMIVEEQNNDPATVFVGIMEGALTIPDVNGEAIKKYAVTLTGVGDDTNVLNDARHAKTIVEVPGGATVTQTWRMRTIRHDNVVTAGTDRGFLVFDAMIRTEQGLVV